MSGTQDVPLDPKVIRLEPLPLLPLPPQAANSGAAAASPATPAIPLSSERRSNSGTPPARLGNGDRGTEGPGISSPPRGSAQGATRPNETEHNQTTVAIMTDDVVIHVKSFPGSISNGNLDP